jgi:hypothetical protein
MKKNNAFLTTATFPCHPLIFGINHFGRPDHHAFIMLFMVIYLKSIIEVVLTKFNGENLYLKPAIVATLCVWISPETLIPILLTDGILFIYAFSDMEKLKFLHMKNTLIACGVGMIAFFSSHQMFSYVLTACILLMVVVPYATTTNWYQQNRILKYWHIVVITLMLYLCPLIAPVEYDKISAVHVFLFVCSAVYFGIGIAHCRLELKRRTVLSAVWFVIIATVFLFLYPKFFSGMSANIDDYVKEIWLNEVRELQSPLAGSGKVDFLIYCVILVISIGSKVTRLLSQKRAVADIIWYILMGNAAIYTILAAMAYRMQPYAILFGLPIIVDFAVNGDFGKSIHRLWRVVGALFLTTFFLFLTGFFSDSACSKSVSRAYTPRELFELIDNLSQTPAVIMACIDDGPALLYHTKHSVVGAPYHRQERGIISSHKIMDAKYDEETVKSILKSTGSSYIFIKKYLYDKKRSKPESLAQMLINNNCPDWINILKLPQRFSDVIIAKIDQEKL